MNDVKKPPLPVRTPGATLVDREPPEGITWVVPPGSLPPRTPDERRTARENKEEKPPMWHRLAIAFYVLSCIAAILALLYVAIPSGTPR